MLLCRETLLGQLTGYVRSIRDEFATKSASSSNISLGPEQQVQPSGKNLPRVVNSVVWTRQLGAKISDTLSTAEALLGNLSGFQKFKTETSDFREELKDYQREQFDSWSRQVLVSIDHPSEPLRYLIRSNKLLLYLHISYYSLETSGRLMELSHKDGKLRVHYSDKLVTLLREVRQLAAFGFSIPSKIQHVSNSAQKFYKHGVILKQVYGIQ